MATGEQTSASAFVVGPTGVGLGRSGMPFVADTVANRITAIPNAAKRLTSAGTERVVTSGGALVGPLGLAIAPNDDVLTVNGGNGKIVEPLITAPQPSAGARRGSPDFGN